FLLAGCASRPGIPEPLSHQGDVLQCVAFVTPTPLESPAFEELQADPQVGMTVLPGIILEANQAQNVNLLMPNGDELAISVAEYNPKYLKDTGAALVSFSYQQRTFS